MDAKSAAIKGFGTTSMKNMHFLDTIATFE